MCVWQFLRGEIRCASETSFSLALPTVLDQ